ncbi:hypothetical protein G6F65_019824 [Rhizopus arrhizus]|nr:hypothetical protein G6F65_019824 [Rhizopus arrhizus]
MQTGARWRPVCFTAMPCPASAARGLHRRRRLVAVRHVGASHGRHGGQRQQDSAAKSLRHACPSPFPVGEPHGGFRHDYTGARARQPAQAGAKSPATPVTSPDQKGTKHCGNVTPTSGTPASPARRRTPQNSHFAPLHLPTARFDRPATGLVR